jgi:hypothetical protein
MIALPDGAEVLKIPTAQAMLELRENNAFHEGAMSVLTYPTAPPVAFFDHETPRLSGVRVNVGDAVWKDPAGNFGVIAGGASE